MVLVSFGYYRFGIDMSIFGRTDASLTQGAVAPDDV